MTLDRDLRIAALEELVEAQAARIRDLEQALVTDFEPPVQWNLRCREAQILGMLIARPRVTKEQIFSVFYTEDEADSPQVIESHVSKLRKRLKPFGIVIRAERYLGYSLLNREQFQRTA